MTLLRRTFSVALVAASSGCTPAGHPAMSQSRLERDVRALSHERMAGRAAGTEFEAMARKHIITALDRADIPAPPGGRLQRVPMPGTGTSANVLGVIGGATGLADEFVVLGAHVDHLGMRGGVLHPGAEDNASGVALVLEVGRALKRRRSELGRSVMLVFFGAEEVGKLGSRAYVNAPAAPLERTVAMVNIDMIGLPLMQQPLMWLPKVLWGIDDQRSVGIVGTEGLPGLRAIVNQGCRAGALTAVAPEDFPDPIKDLINEQARNRSDDAPFRRAGIPAVFFGSGEADTYHSPDDIVADLSFPLLSNRAAAVADTVVLLSRADWEFVRKASTH